jgi:hypothetical protein
LPKHHLSGDAIPVELAELIVRNDLFSLSGTIGEKNIAHPIEYDQIRIKSKERIGTIEVFNRGTSMILAETSELIRVFPVCSGLRDLISKS